MMKMQIPSRDLEILSAYLDGELTNHQRLRFEAGLRHEPQLKMALIEMRSIRELLRATPTLKAPKNFVIKAEVGRQPRLSVIKNFYRFRMVTAIASFLLMLVFVGDLMGIPSQLLDTGVGSQVVSVKEVEEVTSPSSESLGVEIPGHDVVVTSEEQAERAPSEVFLEAVPGIEEEEQTTVESDSIIPKEIPEVEEETLSEGESEGRGVADGIGSEFIPQWEDEPLMQESPPPDILSPMERDYVDDGEVLPTALDELALDIMEQQPSSGDTEMNSQQLQGDMDGEIVSEQASSNWKSQRILRLVEFLLGVIVILCGILTVHFRKVSRDVG